MKSKINFRGGLATSLLLSSVLLFSQCQKDANEELAPGFDGLPTSTISAVSAASTTPQPLDMSTAKSDGGYAYTINKDFGTPGDSSSDPKASLVRVFENGVEIGPAHSSHSDIRNIGKGRFSHWGGKLYISATDNSNPKTNGKKYTYLIGTPAPVVNHIALNVANATKDSGFAYKLKQNLGTTGDSGSQPTISTVRIFENGVELGPAHSAHADIRNQGKGRFSHWGSVLYFSASDNTNPSTNGRKYTYAIGGSTTVTPTTPTPTPEPTPTPTPVPSTTAIGYASVDGQTTGGQGGQTVTVSTLSALKSALSSSSPMIVQVSGTITGTGYVTVNSNKTIIGLSGSSMQGVGLYIYGKSNIIVRNMTIRNVKTYSNIIIKENAHHIWVDHCTLTSTRLTNDWTTYDGLLDVTRGASYVTVSWNKFSDSHIPMLIGGGEGTTSDIGKLKVTIHNNSFINVSERQPRVSFGTVHVFNNYIKGSSGYAIAAAMGGTVRTDNNYFENANVPISTEIGSKPGYISGASTNIYKNSGANRITTAASTWLPPYSYQSSVIPAADVPSAVLAGAGAK